MPPLFPEPEAKEQKPPYREIPASLLDKIGQLAKSPVVTGEVAWGGFSAAAGFVLTLKNGRKIFAKGNHPGEMAHGTQNLRQEIFAYQKIPQVACIAPRYIGLVSDGDEDGWMLGLWDYVPHASARPSIAKIVETIAAWHADTQNLSLLKRAAEQNYISFFFSPDRKWKRLRGEEKVAREFLALFGDAAAGETWLEKNLPALCRLQENFAALSAPEVLVHGDLRADNIFQGADGKVYIVDWPNACRGPAVFDLLFLFADIEAAGGAPVEDLLRDYQAAGGQAAAPEQTFSAAAALSGFLADQARRSIPEKLPRLRWMQKSILVVLLRFLARAGALESLPRMQNQRG